MLFFISRGGVAQLGERYTGSVEVNGSIPSVSTNKKTQMQCICVFIMFVIFYSITFLIDERSSSKVSSAGISGFSALILSVLLNRKPAFDALIIPRSL
jgi:hypothetical protein